MPISEYYYYTDGDIERQSISGGNGRSCKLLVNEKGEI